jgi:hypothetical protein
MTIHSLFRTASGWEVQGSYLAPGRGTFTAHFSPDFSTLLRWDPRPYRFTSTDLLNLIERKSLA